MYLNNIKKIRKVNHLEQADLMKILNCKNTTYSAWENNKVMIPLDVADKLAMFYKASLAYIIGVEKNYTMCNYKEFDYDKLLNNLLLLKIKNKYTYEDIADYLKCDRSTCSRYLSGKIILKIDVLIKFSNLFHINIDELCGKK